MEKISGLITRIVFRNEQNSWTVCEIEQNTEKIAVVGNLPPISVGENVALEGNWVTHAEYGKQFSANFCEVETPQKKDEILRYLASGVIRGIRLATAEKIVNEFGEESLNIIADEPEKLSNIKGITLKKALAIGESYMSQIGTRDVIMFLQKYGITPLMATKIYHKYKMATLKIVKSNPYLLSDDIKGIGFETADRIAQANGISPTSHERIASGLLHILRNATYQGHTNLPETLTIEQTTNLLEINSTDVQIALDSMIIQQKLFRKNECIFIPSMFFAEKTVASKVAELANQIFKPLNITSTTSDITLAPLQIQAIEMAQSHGMLVITGGPGTGKTTIINTIIQIMQSLDKTTLLAAPTGRAAKRMSELSGIEAKTIHRLLEIERIENEDTQYFARNEDNPLECDCLIIDEASMLDIQLASALLSAIKPETRLILVGDVDQLSPVGAGDVLRDIINTEKVPVVKLTDIFRQSQDSYIVTNAHRINKGESPEANDKNGDFFIMRRDSSEDIAYTIVDLVHRRLKERDCQVLTPMRKGIVGVYNLNSMLQAALNPPADDKPEIKGYNGQIFRTGDKIMQTKNNYDIEWIRRSDNEAGSGIFNGDIGFIEHIDEENDLITAIFDDEKVLKYNSTNLVDVELAYATTVHKSQGSEYDAVIVPIFPCAPMLATRNLLYTAVTRAKKMVILVGRESAMNTMISNDNIQPRYSQLKEAILCHF